AVEGPHRGLDGRPDVGAGGAQGGEAALDDLLLAVALGDLVGGRVGAGGQVAQGRQDAAQLAQVLVPVPQVGQGGEGVFEDGGVGAGGQGQAGRVSRKGEPPLLVGQPDLARLEHPAVLVLQEREEDLVLQVGVDGAPVDVEEGGVGGARAVLQ